MLTITVPEQKDIFDEKKNEFLSIKGATIQLEHSLISLRKWESKWHKPFLDRKDHTPEESLDYVRCMTLTPHVDPLLYYVIPQGEMIRISEYIKDPMTATWFGKEDNKKGQARARVITAEVIYYWMIELGVPVEFEKWHLNQLLTFIRVINVERTPNKKMSKSTLLKNYSALNAQRRAALRTKG